MKVGLTATMIQGGRSGVAQYVFSLVKELIQDPRIHLHLFVLEEELSLFAFAQGRCEVIAVPTEVASPVKNILWHQTALPRIAGELQLDVLHVPSYRRLVFRAPCPTVGTIHDLAPFHVKGKYDIARMFYGRVIVKALARAQKEIIAISQSTATDIERFFGIPQKQLHLIFNGIDHERFHPGDRLDSMSWMQEKHQISAPFFLYVSRLEHPAKNHVRLIEAFDRFKSEKASPHQLVLGGGDWHGSEIIRAAAASSPFAKDIHFLGFVPDADLPHLYRAARAMVYPSLFEGFGLPPVEAMACATPVISSTRGALQEVVGSAALVIDPENPQDIAKALLSLAEDDSLHARYRALGLENAQRFHWHNTAQAVIKVYEKACGQNSLQSS
jgi:glycosyltransferase involved in cell wall biosynthesis